MKTMTKPIRIWRFSDAPKRYQISIGGDEDWVAFVPTGYEQQCLGFLDEGTSFGYCKVKVFKTKGGTIHIGAHA